MQTYDLAELGWTPQFAQAFEPHAAAGLVPFRVGAQHRGRFVLYGEAGEPSAEPSGKLRHSGEAFPAVGDWVAARQTGDMLQIEAVLPRRSAFVRADQDRARPDGVSAAEVLAANLDLVFVVMAAHQDLNLRRLERYLAAAWESGAEPWVILTKTDLVENPEALKGLVQSACPGAQVLLLSNLTGEGVESVRQLIGPGRTAALLGSSGVGKSSLVNRFIGEARQAVSEVRDDGRGRHTTTHRELILLPGGGMVLDTPGMRQFQPLDDAGLEATFADVEDLARTCRFGDCSHTNEPGCAVLQAIGEGRLERSRLDGYAKLRRELAHSERKDDKAAESTHRKRWRSVHRMGKERMRQKRSGLD